MLINVSVYLSLISLTRFLSCLRLIFCVVLLSKSILSVFPVLFLNMSFYLNVHLALHYGYKLLLLRGACVFVFFSRCGENGRL